MDNGYDDYYYRLGRYQATLELKDNALKSRPMGLNEQQMRDWRQGYNEMSAEYFWTRRQVKE